MLVPLPWALPSAVAVFEASSLIVAIACRHPDVQRVNAGSMSPVSQR